MSTILIVDDHPLNRQFLLALLGFNNHRLLEASDGAQGLALAGLAHPDLIITDIMMPTMDGFAFITQLRADPVLTDIPVIFYTSTYSMHEANILAQACGARGVLQKPSAPKVILTAVNEALGLPPPGTAAMFTLPKTETGRFTVVDNQMTHFLRNLDADNDLVAQISGALQDTAANATLLQATQRLSQTLSDFQAVGLRLTALIDMSIDLASEQNPQRLIETGCRIARHIGLSSYAVIGILDPDGDGYVQFNTRGLTPALHARIAAAPPPRGMFETVRTQRQPQHRTGLGGDPARVGLAPDHPAIHSLLVAPIASPGQCYGWLYLVDKQGADQFSDIDQEVLVALATQIAVAYENLLLFERGRLNLAQLERDSIEHAQMADRLQQSEIQFRQLAENINEVFFLNDAINRTVLYISPAYERIWGRTCASLVAEPRSWMEAIHPDDRNRIRNHARRRHDADNMATRDFDYRYRVLRPDGEVRFIHSRGFSIRNELGQVYRIAGIAEDITAYIHATEELAESERRYSDMLANVGLLSLMVDCSSRITYCNDFLLRLTGWERQEVMGGDWFLLFLPPQHHEELQGVHVSILNDVPSAAQHQSEILTRSGEHRLIQWNNSVLRSSTGKAIGVASIGEDITDQTKLREALREREAGLQRAQQISKLAHVITGPDGVFESWSATLTTLLGVNDEDIPRNTRDWLRIVHPADLEQFKRCCIEAGCHGTHHEIDYRVRYGTHGWRQFHQVLEPLSGLGTMKGRTRWINTLQDVTEQKEQQKKLARLSRIYAVQSSINSVIVHCHERQSLLREVCRVAVTQGFFSMAWAGIIDTQSEQIRSIDWLHDVSDQENTGQCMPATVLAGTDYFACCATRGLGILICNDIAHEPMLAAVRAELCDRGHQSLAVLPLIVSNRAVAVVVLFARDPYFFDTEEQLRLDELAADLSFGLASIEKEERLNFLAYYDALTRLPNRNLFHDRLTHCLNGCNQTQDIVCVVVININRFGPFNDALGRHAGDALLQMVAERLTANLTTAYSLARLGGDTFAAALTGLQPGAATELVERFILEPLDKVFLLDGQKRRLSARAGLALYPDDGIDAESLLKHAELAVKIAKSSGARSLSYAPQMNAASTVRHELENALRAALEGQQFVVYYQPRVDLATGRIVSAEALIRWQHPQRGMVPPVQFIPLCEETGLIVPIGAWVIDTVCAQLAAWRDGAIDIVPVAVNLSALQFRKGDLIQTIAHATAAHNLAQKYLEFELTESMVMNDPEQAISDLRALKNIGAVLSLDDFGTGYSSLAYLQRFPFDFIKLDRSFVTNIISNPGDAAIVNAVIAMAHSLKMQVVAEGVETAEQLRYLYQQHCDQLQGYFFSRPIQADEFAALLREDRRLAFTPPAAPHAGMA